LPLISTYLKYLLTLKLSIFAICCLLGLLVKTIFILFDIN
jgi:hypothetical protein